MAPIFEKLMKRLSPSNSSSSLNPMVLLIGIVFLCAVLTYIIPAGRYNRIIDESGNEIIDPHSFEYIERTPVTPLHFLQSLTLGLQNAANIIFFLMIIGGMFAILNGTGALNVGIANMIHKIKGREILMIPILMLLFGCGSAFCGNFEEFLVFVPLILACCITVGYDSLTAVGIIFIAASAGYGGAITNAFTVGTAQEIAGLPLFSGMNLRIILFIVLLSVSINYLCIYANMIKKNPRLSGAYSYDQQFNMDKKINLNQIPKLTTRQAFVIAIFICGIIMAVWGIINRGYYIDELSAIFLFTGIICGIVGGLNINKLCEAFEKGFKDMVLPCIMIGLANAIVVILRDANIMDTILHTLADVLVKFPSSLLSWGMFFIQDIFNIFVPSGSTQAKITMPLMLPIADAGGVSRQTAILAYQLGDAFTNIVTPTGGEILAALAICKVPFGKWLKFLLPLFVIWIVIALIFLSIAVHIGY